MAQNKHFPCQNGELCTQQGDIRPKQDHHFIGIHQVLRLPAEWGSQCHHLVPTGLEQHRISDVPLQHTGPSLSLWLQSVATTVLRRHSMVLAALASGSQVQFRLYHHNFPPGPLETSLQGLQPYQTWRLQQLSGTLHYLIIHAWTKKPLPAVS